MVLASPVELFHESGVAQIPRVAIVVGVGGGEIDCENRAQVSNVCRNLGGEFEWLIWVYILISIDVPKIAHISGG